MTPAIPATPWARLLLFAVAALILAGCDGRTNSTTREGKQDMIDSATRLPLIVHDDTLDNGLRLLCVEDRSAPVFTIMFFVPCGGRTEPADKSGISHYLEHAYSMGSSKLKPRELDEIVARHGGSKNAFTSDDYTAYYENMPIEQLDMMLELEADRLATNRFPDERFASELSVVLEEKRMRYDNNPRARLWSALRDLSFTQHPYRIMTIGTDESIRNITADDTREYFRKHYTTENVTYILVGDFDAADARRRFENFFGGIPRGPRPDVDILPEPIQHEERRLAEPARIPLPTVQVAFRTPSYSHPDAPALDLLEAVLGSGLSARLDTRLHKQLKLANSVSCYHTRSVDGQSFVMTAECAEGVTPEQLEAALWNEIDALVQHGVTQTELETACNRIDADLLGSLDSSLGTSRMLAQWEVLTPGGWRDLLSYPSRLRALRPQDVNAVAGRYFVRNHANVVTLLPENWTSPAQAESPADLTWTTTTESGINRCVFSNGLTMLHERVPKLPNVIVRAQVAAGSQYDPQGGEGLAQLTAALLTAGTDALGEDELAQRIDAMGSTLGAGASLYSTTVESTSLSRHFEDTLRLQADVLRRAAFGETAFRRERDRMLAGVESRKTRASDLARDEFMAQMFAGHPAGRRADGTKRSLQSFTREQVREFHRSMYAPDRTTLIVVGDVDLQRAAAAVAQQFNGWQPVARNDAAVAPPAAPDRQVVIVNKPDQTQANVFIGHPAVQRNHPDYPAITLMNNILGGGGLSSRVTARIRTKMGLAYSAYCTFSHLRDSGAYYAGFQTKNESLGAAIDALLEEIELMRNEGVTEEELNNAKSRYLGNLPFTTQTNANRVELYATAVSYDLPLDFPRQRAEAMRAVSAEDIQRVAREHLHPDKLVFVVATQADAVRESLAKYGPVQVKEIED